MNRDFGSDRKLCFVALLLCLLLGQNESSAQSTSKSKFEGRVRSLETAVARLAEKQRDLEARIAVLERLNLTPAPEVLRESYVRSARDAIISFLVNLAANAYQFRIRPTTMGGGGGSYAGYSIPKRMVSSDFASYAATAYPESVVFSGTSTRGLGTVQTTMNDTGRTGHWIYTGDFE